jgi:YHS domain-containing protein
MANSALPQEIGYLDNLKRRKGAYCLTTAVKDPVCGMDIDPATAAGKSEYQGQTYYFSSMGCKKNFDKEPEKYIGHEEQTKQ